MGLFSKAKKAVSSVKKVTATVKSIKEKAEPVVSVGQKVKENPFVRTSANVGLIVADAYTSGSASKLVKSASDSYQAVKDVSSLLDSGDSKKSSVAKNTAEEGSSLIPSKNNSFIQKYKTPLVLSGIGLSLFAAWKMGLFRKKGRK